MPLSAGTRLGPYEIVSAVGVGGMGEVYRARDTKLGRDVALKVLPEAVAADPDRLARFEREARTLAALNHPHIAHVHGFEDSGGVRALVMELVEGPTLADRLERGPVPLDEALPIARQIADALEAAHEQGIVHRDLKPANIKVRDDGTVKVLDFGLAKALDAPASSSLDPATSPTITSPAMTRAGVILGTAAYMAPEQARGRPVDKRADIWAFGVVLYEMLTGARLFAGESVSDTLAEVLKTEPDWTRLPPATPLSVARLLRRCLTRDPRARLRDIGEARIALAASGDDRGTTAPAPSAPSWPRSALLLATGVIVGAGAVVGVWRRTSSSAPAAGVARFAVALPNMTVGSRVLYPSNAIAISRDGSVLAVVGWTDATPRLLVRRRDELQPREIAGTRFACNPFFSPDGRWLAFFDAKILKKVSSDGGDPVVVARDMPDCGWGALATWTDDGRIVFDRWSEGLRVIPEGGGPESVVTTSGAELHSDPQVLPHSDRILFDAQDDESQRVDAVSIDGSKRKTILRNASHARYLASGHLLFMRDGALMVAPFDPDRLEARGAPAAVRIDVEVDARGASAPLPQLAVSLDGTLAYAPVGGTGGRRSRLVWVDRGGRMEEAGDIPLASVGFQLSPDGTRLALAGRDGPAIRVATYDLVHKTLTPVTAYAQEFPHNPVWFPDGRRLLLGRYGMQRGELVSIDVESNAPPQSIVKLAGTWIGAFSTSRDGRYALFSLLNPKSRTNNVWLVDLAASGGPAARPFLATSAEESLAALSPDGQWVAYTSDESGEMEVYVRRFPGGESKRRVSEHGATGALWSHDGRELFFGADFGRKLMSVSVSPGSALTLGDPHVVLEGQFESSVVAWKFAVSPDGKRFLMSRSEPIRAEVVIVQHWFDEVRRMTAAAR